MSTKSNIKKGTKSHTNKFNKNSTVNFLTNNHIFILGMHRSGTSCLTGILEENGLYLGETAPKHKYNKKGDQENIIAMEINECLLTQNNSSWYSPKEIEERYIPFEIKLKILKLKAKMLVKSRLNGHNWWGRKDPRSLFCLSAWINSQTTLIGTFRHPYKVASSLKRRGGEYNEVCGKFEIADLYKLWFTYNSKMIELYRERPFTLLNFDWDSSVYKDTISYFLQKIGMIETQMKSEFFDESLVNEKETKEIEDVRHRKLYEDLQKISEIEREKLAASFNI